MMKKKLKKIRSFVSINVYKGQGLKIILILFMLVLLSSNLTLAETIWSIGADNRDSEEYEHPHSDPKLNQEIVNYRVPPDWDIRGIDGWKSFPCKLWPSEAPFYPKEIHITYDYPKDYRNVKLRIVAKTVWNFTQRLTVLKLGTPEDPNNEYQLIAQFAPFEFTLGNIKKGLQEENKIIIRNKPVSKDYSIYFDYLELVDQDQDGDGSLDYEEIKVDTDGDGYENSEDRDTASLIIQSYDGSVKKNITLDIEEGVDSKPYFTEIVFMDTNSPGFPPGLPGDLFFPYCFFRAGIQIPADKDRIDIQILYPEDETIYPTAQFYINKDFGEWERIPAEIIDGNILLISIDIDIDTKDIDIDTNNSEDNDNRYSQEEGVMTITGGLAYPQGVGIDLDSSKCFVSSLIF